MREYAAPLELYVVARRIATSRRQLQRAYAQIGATSFQDQLAAVRMERAAELLAHDLLPVREVARRVGYRQPSQFAKRFRRHHGLSPVAFRERHAAVAPPAGLLAA